MDFFSFGVIMLVESVGISLAGGKSFFSVCYFKKKYFSSFLCHFFLFLSFLFSFLRNLKMLQYIKERYVDRTPGQNVARAYAAKCRLIRLLLQAVDSDLHPNRIFKKRVFVPTLAMSSY